MERDRTLWQGFEADPREGVRLRIYGWNPPALSLGFHQDERGVDRHRLRESGYDLVRRPTGGAAVLHADEVTYAVAAPLGTPGLGRAVLQIHGAIADAMAAAFRSMGVAVDFGGDGVPREFACFSGAGGHEITLDGRKLAGSALRRGRRAFLQHGSILRGERHLDLAWFMADASEDDREAARDALAAKTSTLPGLEPLDFGDRLARALGERCGLAVRRVGEFGDLLHS
jgi:lipoate-protein ligase A